MLTLSDNVAQRSSNGSILARRRQTSMFICWNPDAVSAQIVRSSQGECEFTVHIETSGSFSKESGSV